MKNTSGQELGYLSFQDDRMYYVLIPLFEQRRVRVKLLVTGEPRSKTRRKTGPVYLPLDLCVRLKTPAGQEKLYPDNINRQIDEMLMKYRYDA